MNKSSQTSRWWKLLLLTTFLSIAILGVSSVFARSDVTPTPAVPSGIYRGVSTAVKFDVSPPLSSIPPGEIKAGDAVELLERNSGLEGAFGPQDVDTAVQSIAGPNLIPGPLTSFDGPGNIAMVSPPDPVGDVGPNHYVAMSNLYYAVYDKTGSLLLGPAANNTLWAGFGGDCETDNSGDPIVLYDQISDRWMLSQFTASGPTFFNCVAVSTSPDPTGTYYRWAFSTGGNFPDYPKYGFWSDALYISTREFLGTGGAFQGMGAYAINRSELIAGNPTPQVISFLATPASAGGQFNIGDGLLPTDMDGTTLPPAGSPNYFVGSMDDGGPYGATQDALTIWEFDADFVIPGNSTFTLVNTVPVDPFDSVFPCTPGSRDCIPQPGTAQKIDILSYRQRPLWRLAYRNFGGHEALVTNQSVEATGAMAGVRWYEIRDPNGTPTIFQQGTYAPADGIHRWMGSIAMDQDGNMGLGFSASNATTTFPSSWYTGRLVGDPLGTMPQGEASIINGTGSQTGSPRWGDYTSMNVDPVDDCTFWYVNEYVPVTSSVGWRLRIGSFKFDECGSPDFTLSATPDTQAICAGTDALYTINVGSIQGFTDDVTLGAIGNPAPSTATFSVNPVTPPGSSDLTISNTAGVATGSYSIDVVGTAPTSTHTTTVQLDVFAAAPGAPTLVDPADGATGVPFSPTFVWTAVADATSYFLEVADDAGFSNIVYSATETTTSHPIATPLDPLTTYYWRVTGENGCGMGSPSTPFSFTTDALPDTLCSAPALPIPDNSTVSDSMTVVNAGLLQDMDISINADHTWVGDMTFVLSHDGVDVTIIDRPGYTGTGFGCSGDNVDITALDDEGVDGPVENQCANAPALFGNPTPNNPLSAFDGQDLSGDWTLSVSDGAGGDTGTLNNWCLIPTVDQTAPVIAVEPASLATTQTVDLQVTHPLTISNLGDADLTWTIVEDDGATNLNPNGGWADNFDSYATGSQMHGQGGWKGWDNSPAAGALTSSAQARSAPNSVDTLAGTDLVHEYTGYTSGQWVYTAWQYIPSSYVGQAYFILLNTYADGGPNNWSTQVCFDAATDQLYDDVGATCSSASALPIVYDQWVEIRVEIDLDTDSQTFYYDNQMLFQDTWTGHVSGAGALNMGAVDLFANGASSVFYDDMSLAEPGSPTPAICELPSDVPWLSVSPDAGTTATGETSTVDVTFDSTGLTAGSTYTATLCVESNDAVTPLVTVPVSLTVEASVYGVSVDTADAAESGAPGDTITYTVWVTNEGNVADTFDLTVTNNVWTTMLSDSTLTLAAGASAEVMVMVHIDLTAVNGDSDTATVTATSQADATATDSVDLTTTAVVPPEDDFLIFLPIIMKP